MKHSAPRRDSISAPYWQGAREGVLRLPFCVRCAAFRWPARVACPACEAALEWREARGCGTVSTWSIVRRAPNPELKEAEPYVVAIVDLDEGVRLFTNIVDTPVGEVRTGLRVSCRFEPSADDTLWVPVFAPCAAEPST